MFNSLKNFICSSSFNLSFAMIIVGSSVICGKLISVDIPLFLTSEIRFLLATVLFLPFGVYTKDLFRLSFHDWVILFFMALCGQVIFTVLLLLGLRYTSGITAGTLTSTTPLFMAIIAFFLLKEHYGKKKLTACFLSVASIYILGMETFHSLGSSNLNQMFGNLMILSAVLGESCFLLLGKKLESGISGIKLTAVLSLFGVIICLPAAIYDSIHFNFHSISAGDIFAMMYLGWIYTNLAYICWFHGLKNSSGSNAGVYTVLMPISASLCSLCLMNESINCYQIAALLLAIASILISSYRTGKKNYEELQ